MVFSLFEYLDQSIAITDKTCMFTFGKFFTQNAITFDVTKTKKKIIFQVHEILLRIHGVIRILKLQ